MPSPPPTPGRRRTGVLAAVALTLAALVVTPSSAAAEAAQYVALGDSYASGLAAGSYLDDGEVCWRSADAYPELIAAARRYSLSFRACAGASTLDIAANQLSTLGRPTQYVTISAGANDMGWYEMMITCGK